LNRLGNLAHLRQLFAFYQVAILNTIFGYSLYAALIFFGLKPYVAQVISQITGMAFNYVMYRGHVFKDSEAAVLRYLGTYAVNYGIQVALLALFLRWVPTLVLAGFSIKPAYSAGFLALLVASLVNFVALKFFVFRKSRRAAPVLPTP
jgi:putative flippase GtrA